MNISPTSLERNGQTPEKNDAKDERVSQSCPDHHVNDSFLNVEMNFRALLKCSVDNACLCSSRAYTLHLPLNLPLILNVSDNLFDCTRLIIMTNYCLYGAQCVVFYSRPFLDLLSQKKHFQIYCTSCIYIQQQQIYPNSEKVRAIGHERTQLNKVQGRILDFGQNKSFRPLFSDI